MFDRELLTRLLGDEKLAGSVGYTSIQFQSFNLPNTISTPPVPIVPVLRYGPLRYALPSLRALPYSEIRSLRVSREQRGCIEERATQDPTQDRRNFPAPFQSFQRFQSFKTMER